MSRIKLPVLIATWIAFVALVPTAAWAEDPAWLQSTPANTWIQLPTVPEANYRMSEAVYAPSRGQILHWGAVNEWTGGGGASSQGPVRNDVRAFDVHMGRWTSDYPSDETPQVAFSISGLGEMLDSGNPRPGNTVGGVAYDSTRDRLVFAMPGLMAAYDPQLRVWEVLDATTSLASGDSPGAPLAYGTGIAYDPVNDEVLMFSQWGLEDQSLVGVDGEVSGHTGTLVFRYRDGTWRSLRDELGSEALRGQRQSVSNILERTSEGLDLAHAARRTGELDDETVECALDAAADAADALAVSDAELQEVLTDVASDLRAAADAAGQAEHGLALKTGSRALWSLKDLLSGTLAIEPPPRADADLVYHPEHELIVLYGGIGGPVRTDLPDNPTVGAARRSDTWVYDPHERSWREIAATRRPVAQARSHLMVDPESGLVLMVTRPVGDNSTVALWGLDLETESWALLDEQTWAFPWDTTQRYGVVNVPFEIAYDPEHRLLLMTQLDQTYAMKLDLAALTPQAVPEHTPLPAVVPLEVPPDDPAWRASLDALPPNTWQFAEPEGGEPARRDWGNIAYDRVRGWIYYFGGGHSSYQVNDVAIYAVGANRWVNGVGDHNDRLPPVGWGGNTMGFDGGPHAKHQRNTYTAVDGRMYAATGGVPFYQGGVPNLDISPDVPRYSWWYDVDRGGLWRQSLVDVELGDGVPGAFGGAQMSDPRGRVFGFEIDRGNYYAHARVQMWIGIHDIYSKTLEVRGIEPPYPPWNPEAVPFAYMPDSDRIFFYGHGDSEVAEDSRAWAYDFGENRFVDLEAVGGPQKQPSVVVYLEGQNAIFAAVDGEQWLFSLQHREWETLPSSGDSPVFASPYGQLVYASRYGVLVNVSQQTAVMRIDATSLWPDLEVTEPAESFNPISSPPSSEECGPDSGGESTTTGDDGSGTSGEPQTGVTTSGSIDTDTGGADPGSNSPSSGCGCRTQGNGDGSVLWTLPGLLLVRRRRRNPR